ncbi:MAG TPA: alkaline phosphatase family protein [Kofleriaceae bacterium]
MMQRSRTVLLGALSLLGCANNSGNTNVACDPLTRSPALASPAWKGGTVFTIVMENHSRGQIFGNKDAPYINQLTSANAVAEGYHDSFVHPSEPNYFWMVAGQNFGVLDDSDPASHHLDATSHLADQLELAGLSWKAYQESMGAPCGLTSHGRYAAKHNPFAYFNDINGWDGKAFHPEQRCNTHVVDYSQLDADIANHALPSYVFITPNLDNDMHDGSISLGDGWLAREIPKLMATDNYKNSGVIFLMWDEGGGSPASDDPPFIVISPNAVHGMKSQVDYDTSSYLKTVQSILGVPALPCAAATDRATVEAMTDLFTAPLTSN